MDYWKDNLGPFDDFSGLIPNCHGEGRWGERREIDSDAFASAPHCGRGGIKGKFAMTDEASPSPNTRTVGKDSPIHLADRLHWFIVELPYAKPSQFEGSNAAYMQWGPSQEVSANAVRRQGNFLIYLKIKVYLFLFIAILSAVHLFVCLSSS